MGVSLEIVLRDCSKLLTQRYSDWFRLETLDDSFQPTIDMLLNVTVFIWFGAVAPWSGFAHNPYIPLYRLVPLGILILLLRRLPVIFAMRKKIHQIEEFRQMLFVGFFGPIGVSAIFYLYVSVEFLHLVEVDGVQREDAHHLAEVMKIVVWFVTICSIVGSPLHPELCTTADEKKVIHGLSIPVGKLGLYLPRTISQAISRESTDVPPAFHVDERAINPQSALQNEHHDRQPSDENASKAPSGEFPLRPMYRIGGSIIKNEDPNTRSPTDTSENNSNEKTQNGSDDGIQSIPLSTQAPGSRSIAFGVEEPRKR